MARDWSSHVYRTDETPETYVGFFLTEAEAKAWIKKRKVGTYEVSTDRPRERKAALGAADALEGAGVE